ENRSRRVHEFINYRSNFFLAECWGWTRVLVSDGGSQPCGSALKKVMQSTVELCAERHTCMLPQKGRCGECKGVFQRMRPENYWSGYGENRDSGISRQGYASP